jgi:hypothetical protein
MMTWRVLVMGIRIETVDRILVAPGDADLLAELRALKPGEATMLIAGGQYAVVDVFNAICGAVEGSADAEERVGELVDQLNEFLHRTVDDDVKVTEGDVREILDRAVSRSRG